MKKKVLDPIQEQKPNKHYTAGYILAPVHPVTINLVGVGGTGSQVLTALARIQKSLVAIGHPGIFVRSFDPDIITEANIGRQLYSPVDVGLNKAITITNRINRFFGLNWEAVAQNYEHIAPANMLITCVDNYKTRQKISQMIGKSKRPKNRRIKGHVVSFEPWEEEFYWIDFGNGHQTGQVIIGTVDPIKQPKSNKYNLLQTLPTFIDMFPPSMIDKEEDEGPSCSLAQALNRQDLFINSTLANLGTNLIWKLIMQGEIEHRGLYLNLETLKTNPLTL